MFIKNIKFKNIKSYGNKLQEITFSDKGELILVSGKNGHGKTTIKDVIELCLYNKSFSKTGNRVSLEKLPNRKNDSLYVSIDFYNNKSNKIYIERAIKPNNFKIFSNDIDITDKYKNYTQQEKDDIIGYDINLFKSFLSLNINDLKNFMSLKKSDKELLLNKMFNLEKLDKLHSIILELIKQKSSELDKLNINYDNNIQKLEEYNEIKTSLSIDDINDKILKLKSDILNKKNEFDDLNKIKIDLTNKLEKYKNESNNIKNIILLTEKEIVDLEQDLKILNLKYKYYKQGKCYICDTDLNSSEQINKGNNYKLKINNINLQLKDKKDLLIKNNEINNKLNSNIKSLSIELNSNNTRIQSVLSNTKNLKNEFKYLKNYDTEKHDVINKKINNTIIENNQILKTINEIKNKLNNYNVLKNLCSFNSNIRKNIISKSIVPINKSIEKYISELESIYTLKIDEDFNANIMELGSIDIDVETTSKGEDRKLNLAIVLSYLEMILKKNHTNVIFLDEIFDGVDIDNIDLMLKSLKKLTREYNTNILIVNLSDMNCEHFDKKILVKKDIFSDIEIINN